MYDDETRSSPNEEQFSHYRIAAIESLSKHIVDSGIDAVLNHEIYARTSLLRELGTLSTAIVDTTPHFMHVESQTERSELTDALRAGMAFACWTHDAENNPLFMENIRKSINYSVYHMNYTKTPDTDKSSIFARFESAMECIDAVEATDDAIEPERELVEHCAYNFGVRSIASSHAFKFGYGYIRRAAILPYSEYPERSRYNLEVMGFNTILDSLFKQYCKDDLVHESSDYMTMIGRRDAALTAFKHDPFVENHFTEGQKLALVDGICKISNRPDASTQKSKYHSLGDEEGFVIEGTFGGFVAGPSIDNQVVSFITKQGSVDENSVDETVFAGIHIKLDTPIMRFGANDPNQDSETEALSQTVLVPLNISNQHLIYYN
jgi:hypothetical protein